MQYTNLGLIVHECIKINGDLLEDVGMVDSCKLAAASSQRQSVWDLGFVVGVGGGGEDGWGWEGRLGGSVEGGGGGGGGRGQGGEDGRDGEVRCSACGKGGGGGVEIIWVD